MNKRMRCANICYYAITEEEIETIIEPTKELIQKVEELLKG